MKYILKHKTTIIGAVLGSVAGYSYYYFVGCANGTCAITSNPINSTFYGLIMGTLLFNIFQTNKKQEHAS
jgi:hypothetical protein